MSGCTVCAGTGENLTGAICHGCDGTGRAPAPAPEEFAPWWCPTCQKHVPGEHVTYEENHDARAGGCGLSVLPEKPASVEAGQPSALRASAPEGNAARWRAGCPEHVALWDAIHAFADSRHRGVGSPDRQRAVVAVEDAVVALYRVTESATPASVGEDQPSAAVAASAPEGMRPVLEVLNREIEECFAGEDRARKAGSDKTCAMFVNRRDGLTRARDVVADALSKAPAPASVEAGPSRGAPAPLAPEGQSAPTHCPHCRCKLPPPTGDRREDVARLIRSHDNNVAAGEALVPWWLHAADAVLAHLDASVEAGPSRGASAPLTPEGLDAYGRAFIDDYRAGRIVAVHTALAAFDRALAAAEKDRDDWQAHAAWLGADPSIRPPQAAAKAIPSPAPQAPPPEGTDDREAVLGALLKAAGLVTVTEYGRRVYGQTADAVLAVLRERGWQPFGAAEEYVDFLLHTYTTDEPMTDKAAEVRDKLLDLIRRAAGFKRQGEESGDDDLFQLVKSSLGPYYRPLEVNPEVNIDDGIRCLRAEVESLTKQRDAAIARAEAAEKERDRAWQMLGEFTGVAMFAHPGWAFDGNPLTVLDWIREDYANLAAAQAEAGRLRALLDRCEPCVADNIGTRISEYGDANQPPLVKWRELLTDLRAALSSPGQSQGRGSGEET